MSKPASFSLVLAVVASTVACVTGTALAAPAEPVARVSRSTAKPQTVAVTLDVAALSVSTKHAPAGSTEFVIRNQSGERKSFVIARHDGPLPYFFYLALVRFVPSNEVVKRVEIPRSGQRRLRLALPTGRYALVECEPVDLLRRIVADAVVGLTISTTQMLSTPATPSGLIEFPR